MRRRRSAVVSFLLVAGLALGARAVSAQPWHERYARGLALEEQGKWGAALLEFEAAAVLRPAPAKRATERGGAFVVDYDPHYHMALCLVELRRPGLAVQQLKKSANARVTPADKLVALRTRIEGMKRDRTSAASPSPAPRTGNLSVESDPPGAGIFVDGAAVGTAPVGPLQLSPGVHVVRAEKPGARTTEQHITIAPGDTTNLMVALGPAEPAAVTSRGPAEGRRNATPTQPMPSPSPTVVVAGGVSSPTTPAALPPAVRTIEIPAARRVSPLGVGAAVLAVVVAAGVLWWGGARRRRAARAVPTGPTRTLEHAATVVEAGVTLGGYELQGVLGRGGMATTFRAHRSGDREAVAVKVPHESCLADQTFVARFLREGKLGEQLHHPRIVRILAAGDENGRPYLAMELISGRTLKEELRATGPLPLRRAVEIARDIAEALDYAHAKGVVHRDLKPENVMILPDGTVKVMDFGIARVTNQGELTTTNVFLGTPLYAAPEMVDPKRVDHRADLYALGIILYEMLEGTVPFSADSPYRILEMHQRAPLPTRETLPRRVPARVWSLVERLCEKNPAARYPGAEALLVELNRLLADFPDLDGGDVFE
jgi:hypothetical protein